MKTEFFSLSGKIAVVTGAGSGIGAAIARRFALAGAHVHIWDTASDRSGAVADQIADEGGWATASTVDVSHADSVQSAIDTIIRDESRVDILVNNAGVSSIGDIENTPPEELERVFNVNVAGVANGMRAVLPAMTNAGGGVILNMASIVSLVGVKERFAYSASKGAVLTMTYSVAIDYVKKGIRCNCICPARIHTPFVDDYLARNYPDSTDVVFKQLSDYQPMGRMGTPDEVAALAHYLCSDEAAFVTGNAYPIDGGVCSMPGFS
ncbi:MAG: glucose 1-dehydrogenase [Rhodothermales bacterium]